MFLDPLPVGAWWCDQPPEYHDHSCLPLRDGGSLVGLSPSGLLLVLVSVCPTHHWLLGGNLWVLVSRFHPAGGFHFSVGPNAL